MNFRVLNIILLILLTLPSCIKKQPSSLVEAHWQDLDKEMKDNCTWCGKIIEPHLMNLFEFRGIYPYHYLDERDTTSHNRQIFRSDVIKNISKIRGFREDMKYSNFCSNKCYVDFLEHFFPTYSDTLILSMKSFKRKNNLQMDSVFTLEKSFTYYIKQNEK